jgi:hypothetical protein
MFATPSNVAKHLRDTVGKILPSFSQYQLKNVMMDIIKFRNMYIKYTESPKQA